MSVVPIKKKSESDKFYTKPEVVNICLETLYPFVDQYDIFIEPSAGSGVFLDELKYTFKLGFDIIPDSDEIIKDNWLTMQLLGNDIIIFGNPPFGSRSNLINEFIKKSLPNAKIIAFILPSVFRKENKQKIFPNDWILLSDITLPYNSFLLDGQDYHVPCIFQVWGNEDFYYGNEDLRESRKDKLITNDFKFVSRDNATHFIFGASPRKIIRKNNVTTNNRGYYLRLHSDIIIDQFESINWDQFALSSVSGGVSWFTKQMIINIWEKHYGKFE